MMTTEKTIGTTLVEGVKDLLAEGFSPEDIYTIAEQIKEDADNDAIATEIAEARTKIREGFDQYAAALGQENPLPDEIWEELFAFYEDEFENMVNNKPKIGSKALEMSQEDLDLFNSVLEYNKNKYNCAKKEKEVPNKTKEKKKVATSIEEFNKLINDFIRK